MYKLTILMFLIGVKIFSAIAIEDVDFDKSNDLEIMNEYSIKFDEPIEKSSFKIELLRKNYERLKPSKVLLNPNPLIPKIIHQIWLGGPMPKNYQYYSETWKKYHPSWELKLWSEEDLLNENFSVEDLYWQAESYQERADIMRYAILHRYGGLYVDTDIECLASYDELNHKYDFYAGMETPVVNKMVVSIPNSLIAAIPEHPILTKTLENLRLNWKKAEDKFEEEYSLSKHIAVRSKHFLAVQRSMYPFTESVYNFLQQPNSVNSRSIIFPGSYNTPIFFVNNNKWNNIYRKLTFRNVKLDSEIIIKPETMSLQHYGKERSFSYLNANLAENLYGKNITKLKINDKYFLNFSDLFNKGFPLENITYEPFPLVPEKIYLHNESNLSFVELNHLKNKWQKMNPFFTIEIVDNKLQNYFKDNVFKDHSREVTERINMLYLLYSLGGVYVNNKVKPVDLHKFNYKYSFYGRFINPKDISDSLKLDLNFIAVKPKHIILKHVLSDIKDYIDEYSKITEADINYIYKENVYKYNQLDGKNIVLPESVFEQERKEWVVK